MNIDLYIDELVLHGFSPGDRYPVGDAVQQELTRLFTEQGLPPTLAQGGNVAHLDGGAFQVKSHLQAKTVGGQIASAVYGGLSSISHKTEGKHIPL